MGLHTEAELAAMMNRMKSAQLQTINLTDDDLVKDHLRYFVSSFVATSFEVLAESLCCAICMLSCSFLLLIGIDLSSVLIQMGGRSNVEDELLCRFIFPERPGALMNFLDCISPRWNISLFHYRAQVQCFASLFFFCYRRRRRGDSNDGCCLI